MWWILSGLSVSEPRDAAAAVRRMAAGGKLSHAYLITGPAGAGKREMALALASALVCQGESAPCGRCVHCKKVAAGIHPDVITVAPAEGKRDILVEQVRALRSDVYIRPNEAGRKVYLIDPASALNPSAQNGLLKVLEEGPAYAAFLLLAEAAGDLLPTVRSRCEQIALLPPVEEERPLSEGANALAELLANGTEAALLAHCVGLEKCSRDELLTLLEETIQALERRIKADLTLANRLLPSIDRLKTLRAAGDFNVGTGHLAGWLCAGTFLLSSQRRTL